MEVRELLKALERLERSPATAEDWRDLYETIEDYKLRCLARAIARTPHRELIVAAIKELAEAS